MKLNEIKIEIDRPVSEVFEFTVNPRNTHLWIDSIIEEQANTSDIGIGTIYSQTIDLGDGRRGDSKSFVTAYMKDELIEFSFDGTTYKCRYTYVPITADSTLLIYYEEANDDDELSQPMEQATLQCLKKILESRN